MTSTEGEYTINSEGYLEYTGSKDAEYIEKAVEGMNQAKRQGKIDFTVENGQVEVTQTESIQAASSCAGENDYSRDVQWRGVKHTIKLDHCNTNDLIDAMIAGAGVAQIAAIIAAATGNVAAAAISEIAAVILAAGWQIIDNNAEGEGVVIVVYLPNVVGLPGVDPQ